MALADAIKRKQTYQDYLQTPEGWGYQLINGEIIMSPAPLIKHQRISAELGFLLMEINRKKSLGEIFYAPADVWFDDENVFQPDIFFISGARKHIITEKNIKGSPDIVIEIISPLDHNRDMIIKKSMYVYYGVKEYWIVQPEKQCIEVFVHSGGDQYNPALIFKKGDTLISPSFPDFKIKISALFQESKMR